MSLDVPRVLIADGDAPVRQQLFSTLLTHDIFSDCVAGMSDALTRLRGEKYGVVVLDISLGEIEPVIECISAMPAGARPVVLVLARSSEAARALDVEIVQIVLRKPVNLPQLVDVVRSCIRGSAVRAAAALPSKRDGDYATS
jgi:DNA-binding response OmpR family regulator